MFCFGVSLARELLEKRVIGLQRCVKAEFAFDQLVPLLAKITTQRWVVQQFHDQLGKVALITELADLAADAVLDLEAQGASQVGHNWCFTGQGLKVAPRQGVRVTQGEMASAALEHADHGFMAQNSWRMDRCSSNVFR